MPDDEQPRYQDLPEEELIRLTLDGETRAYDELVKRHSRKLHAMLLQMLRSEADAYDVAQDAFLKAFHSLRYFNGRSAFFTWLYTIAANRARNLLRKRKRENSFSLDNEDTATPLDKRKELEDNSLAGDPSRKAHVTDLKTRLRLAMDHLSPAQREVVTLFDIQGKSFAEISALLGTSEGTLRSRLHYAHKLLQGLLSDEHH